MRLRPGVFIAVLAVTQAPVLAHAIEGFPCLGGVLCSSTEKCVKGVCRDEGARRSSSDPPLPSGWFCSIPNVKENVVVKDFKAIGSGTTIEYSVYVCHERPTQQCEFVKDGKTVYVETRPVSSPMPVWVGIYHHVPRPGPGCKAQPDIAQSLGVLDGTCAGWATTPMQRPAGFEPAWAFAEPGCAFEERVESDNLVVQLPDLTVTMRDRTYYGKRPGTNTAAVKVPLRLCNRGGSMTNPALMGLAFGQPPSAPAVPPSGLPLSEFKWSGKPLVGDSCEDLDWWFPSAGTLPNGSFSGWVVADPKYSVPEASESNNVTRFSYDVAATAPTAR